jgi:hypothetical protein
LDRANVNPDRQIYPVISPGLQPGTTCLTLQVKDRLPLHWRSDVNDKATPGTPLLRMDNAIEYNNLWQYNHQIGLDYNFSPTAMKAENYLPRFYDQPAVASYSAFYRAPFGPGQGLRELYEEMPVNFGYDEVSHQFNLPPPTGSPELMLYASRSSTEIPTRYGPLKIVNQTDILEVSEQTAERDLTMNENLGLKLTVPLEEFAGIHSSVNAGFNFKSFEQRNFATNLAHVSLYSTNTGTPVLVSSATDALAANSGQSVQYVPLSLGWTAARTDRYGNTSVNLSDHLYLSGLASARKNFQAVAEAKEAGGTYTTFRGSVTRVENLPRQWSLMFRGGGQWASEPLIANEEFPLGGISGVRGYREGETYGDTGWHGQLDARAPPINIGYFPYQHTQVPAEVRAAWFMDVGQAWVKESSFSAFNEWGTGPTVYLTASRRFEARLTLGWALRDGVLTHAGGLNGYFNVGVQF